MKKKIKLNTSQFNGNMPDQKLKCIKFKMNLTATILIKNFFKKALFSLNTYICVFPKQLNLPFDLKKMIFTRSLHMFPSHFLAYIIYLPYVSVPISESYRSTVLVETGIRTRSWGRCLRYGHYLCTLLFHLNFFFVGAFL